MHSQDTIRIQQLALGEKYIRTKIPSQLYLQWEGRAEEPINMTT